MNLSRNERFISILNRFGTIPGLLAYSLVLCGILFIIQLLVSVNQNGFGFPLDDAWIHETYARSLAEGRGWSFGLNPPSAGSTSVLWTLLLVPGFWLGTSGFMWWTLALSYITYALLTFLTILLFRKLMNVGNGLLLVFGALIALEWHLLWASGSGMEALLAALGYCLAFFLFLREKPSFFLIGIVTGALFAVRPDGITMIGPAVVILIWKICQKKTHWTSILWLLFGLALPILPLIFHNWSLTGTLFPNTFSAKVTEYAETLTLPFTLRAGRLLSVFITGLGVIFVPGFFYRLYLGIIRRDVWTLSAFVWFFGFILIYCVRLPVNYQHGRYLTPLIPLFLLLGFWGTIELFRKNKVLYPILAASLIVGVGFTTLGIKTFANDVATINQLLVIPARWVETNTLKDSIIAAHDIGALGFYGNREIVDLAGLINPEVIPIIRDEPALYNYILDNNCDYLVVFSDWYRFTENLPIEKSFQFGTRNASKEVGIYVLK